MSLQHTFARFRLAAVGLGLALSACRDADSASTTGSQPIVPSLAGSNGCSAPDVAFTAGSTPAPVVLTVLVTSADSQVCAARGSDVLYATGASGQILVIDVSGPSAAEIELVAPGTVATLLAGAGITAAPQLSGIAVLDATTLLAIERTSNTIIAVHRINADTIAFFAGQPNERPGFAEGPAEGTGGVARFSFTRPSMLSPSGDGRVFVTDPGNHAIRIVTQGFVITATGLGTPGFDDADLGGALFDTPTGVTIGCNQSLIVTERGVFGFGNRLRSVSIGSLNFFSGELQGVVSTFLGDGTPTTSGGPFAGAQANEPVAPFVTTGGEVYWIDAASGVLRRARANGMADCPLANDCASAVIAPTFAQGHAFSMAVTDTGQLFVLDATAGVLFRVAP